MWDFAFGSAGTLKMSNNYVDLYDHPVCIFVLKFRTISYIFENKKMSAYGDVRQTFIYGMISNVFAL